MAQNREKGERVISFEEFKKLVNSSGWEREQRIVTTDHIEYVICVDGVGVKFNNLDDVEVIYAEEWAYDKNDPASFSTTPRHWFVKGVRVLNEDGNEVATSDLANALPREFTTIDYSELNI